MDTYELVKTKAAAAKKAAAKLAAMGYTHIVECGGILDWTGEMQK